MTPEIITVTQFLSIVNETLSYAFPEVVIEGEVSSFKINQSKFVFFDIKDDQNVISCFMMLFALKLPIEDGMKIRITATAKVTKFSKFSLTVKAIEYAGEGELKRAMELLRLKLDKEGLFSPERKRQIPIFPKRIGLITSSTSAAYADFIKILNNRWNGVAVLLADVTVQGPTAPDQILGALDYFNQISPPVDVVALIRGGGSLEDLQAFSTEQVTRAVAASRTPIIVGVGHEIDYSLADYAADVRAATPTDVARLIVPDRREIIAQINHQNQKIISNVTQQIQLRESKLDKSINLLENFLRLPRERILNSENALKLGLERINSHRARLEQAVRTYDSRLNISLNHDLNQHIAKMDTLTRLLRGYDPKAVLDRGYAIVRKKDKIIYSNREVNDGDNIMIQLAKGSIRATTNKSIEGE